jgi:hypothetical protein
MTFALAFTLGVAGLLKTAGCHRRSLAWAAACGYGGLALAFGAALAEMLCS